MSNSDDIVAVFLLIIFFVTVAVAAIFFANMTPNNLIASGDRFKIGDTYYVAKPVAKDGVIPINKDVVNLPDKVTDDKLDNIMKIQFKDHSHCKGPFPCRECNTHRIEMNGLEEWEIVEIEEGEDE